PASREADQGPNDHEAKRSAFNGLAELIVQATTQPGTITVKATGEGLVPAALTLTAKPAALRPAVPLAAP
ncbi:MAG TPA: hypothetical protein VIM58_01955, partial [Candidatus Methylacidiphilales bacterium]